MRLGVQAKAHHPNLNRRYQKRLEKGQQNMMRLLTSHTQSMQIFQGTMTAIENTIAPQMA